MLVNQEISQDRGIELVKEGTTTINYANASGTIETDSVAVTHGLDYIPIPLVYIDYYSSGVRPIPADVSMLTNPILAPKYWLSFEVTSTTLTINLTSDEIATLAIPIRYYLLKETSK